MPTLYEWRRGLITDRKVNVVSSEDLVNKIHDKQNARMQDLIKNNKTVPPMKRPVTVVSNFSPSKDINVKPISLLHSIGVTTTPPVPNLADLSSTWAVIRYIWAFALPSDHNRLCLSDVANDIDFHQKGLLSDEVGVGMAAYLMANFLGTPYSIDVSLALDDPSWGVQQQYGASPDYIFFDKTRRNIKIVECKGNQTSEAYAMDQIRRGTEQLPSIIFNGMPSPDSYVIASHLNTDAVTVFIVDPPGDDGNFFKDEYKTADRVEKLVWQVKNDEAFIDNMMLLNQVKLLSYAGDDETVHKMIGDKLVSRRIKFMRKLKPTAIAKTDKGNYIGTRQILPIPDDVQVEVYKGINEELRNLIAEEAPERAYEFSAKLDNDFTNDGVCNYSTKEFERDGSKIFQSFSADGTLLEISVAQKV